ncbi:MAG: hypothetical protein RLZZ248_1059 [Bacteroidota bacterium]
MVPLTTPDLILFTIHAALKASHSIKKGIADGIRQKSIVLPLPDFDSMVRETTIEFYFQKEGKKYVSQIQDLQKLQEKAQTGILTPSEIKRYRAYYNAFKNNEYDSSSILSYFSIKNLERDRNPPSLLSLIAGNLVSTGIEFYQFFPEKIHPNHFTSKALNGFMKGLDQIPFSEGNFDQKALAEAFFPNLFVGISEWIEQSEQSIKWHPKTTQFVQEVTKGIGEELLADPTLEKSRWGPLLFQSFLSNASTYLQTHSEEKLVKELAGLTLSLLDEKTILSPSGLDHIIRSTLSFSGQIINDNPTFPPHLKSWLAELFKKLAKNPILHPALLPQVVSIAFETVGTTLAEKWKQNPRATRDFLIAFFESNGQVIKNIPLDGWPQKEDFLKIIQKGLLYGLSHSNTLSNKELTEALLAFQNNSKGPVSLIYLLWSISLDAMQHYQMYFNQAMPGYVFQNLFQQWLSFESLFYVLPAQKNKDLANTLCQYYYNEIHKHSPIEERKCQQIMERITQFMLAQPQPFSMKNPQEIINQLESQ